MQNTIIVIALSTLAIFFFIMWLLSQKKLHNRMHEKEREIIFLQSKAENTETNLKSKDLELHQMRTENNQLHEMLSAANTKLQSYAEATENLQLVMADRFRTLASNLLDEKTKVLDQQSQTLLMPLKEEIQKMQKTVSDTYTQGLKDQTNLIGELRKMQDLNSTLQKEAHELSRALKGDSKIQGDWGEVILERVLESSGLTKDREYFLQESFTLEDGKRQRPDAIVKLPDNKNIIIDSKVSLTAYNELINATSEQVFEKALQAHKKSILNHITELANKSYYTLDINTIECVLMFIPIESAFSVIAKEEKEIFEIAWRKNIVIVTPVTLMATLRTISTTWKQMKQTQNTIEIAKRAGLLYDKVANFVSSMDQVDNQLTTLRSSFDTAKKQLSDGSGNLLRQIEMLRELGTKTTKELSNTKIGRSALEE
ncbi:MAG: DNA recombination protein RmuC [Bacteroidales bacterium]|nr:DNA recombination protein RmuC [Bacteroidales bacterium]